MLIMSNVICLARYLKKCAIKKILLLKYLYSESEIEIQTFNKNFMVILQKKKKKNSSQSKSTFRVSVLSDKNWNV